MTGADAQQQRQSAIDRQWALFVAAIGTGQYVDAARIGEFYAFLNGGR